MFGRRLLTNARTRHKNNGRGALRSTRSTMRRSLGFELLEGRQMLSAGNLFAQFVGILTPGESVERLDVSIAPTALQSTSGKAILGFQLQSRTGAGFDPASLQITDAAGKTVAPLYAKADVAGSTDSITLAELRQGDYQIVVMGAVAGRSQFALDVYLVGDADGDHVVGIDDVNSIRLTYGAKAGSPLYSLAADANRDGRIDAIDLSYAVRNVSALPAGPRLMQASSSSLAGGGTNDCVAAVVPAGGPAPPPPRRFYESTYGIVQCMSAGAAVLDVRGASALIVSVDYAEAAYNNTGGYYSVDDAYGGINLGTVENPDFVYPGDEGYRDAALDRLHFITVPGEATLPYEQVVGLGDEEDYISSFLMQNGASIEQVRNGQGHIWFAIDTANADGYAHFLGSSSGDPGYRDDRAQFVVEDLSPTLPNPWGLINDADYNDVVFSVENISINFKSVEFTSDFASFMKTPNSGCEWADSTTVFESPEWLPDERNNPNTQTKDTKLTVKVIVDVDGAGVIFDLIGDGPQDYLDFHANGITSTGNDQEIAVTADANLPNAVNIISGSINWKIKVGTTEIAIGSSGAHKIYVTYGTPVGVATEKRIEAVCTFASGLSDLKDCADAVFDHLPGFGAYVGAQINGPSPIWLLYESNQHPEWRSQCPGHALFVNAHFAMLGLGEGNVKYCYADKDGTYQASDEAVSLQERQIASTDPPHPANTTHDDLSFVERLHMVDSAGNLNNFEASLLFNNYYYVLGFGRNYTSPEAVVKDVFVEVNWYYKNHDTGSDQTDWRGICTVSPWIEGVQTG